MVPPDTSVGLDSHSKGDSEKCDTPFNKLGRVGDKIVDLLLCGPDKIKYK